MTSKGERLSSNSESASEEALCAGFAVRKYLSSERLASLWESPISVVGTEVVGVSDIGTQRERAMSFEDSSDMPLGAQSCACGPRVLLILRRDSRR